MIVLNEGEDQTDNLNTITNLFPVAAFEKKDFYPLMMNAYPESQGIFKLPSQHRRNISFSAASNSQDVAPIEFGSLKGLKIKR